MLNLRKCFIAQNFVLQVEQVRQFDHNSSVHRIAREPAGVAVAAFVVHDKQITARTDDVVKTKIGAESLRLAVPLDQRSG